MTYPTGVGVIDLMMGTRAGDAAKAQYKPLRKVLRDPGSATLPMPAGYMFKDVPLYGEAEAPQGADLLLPFMDRNGVERAMIGVDNPTGQATLKGHPDRFFGAYEVDPNLGMDGVRALVDAYERWGIKAATAFPAGVSPQVPINDKRFYPLYAKCVELDIPICICTGVPGPRVPASPQYVGLLDEVCYDFPDLRVVTRHGCEPWTALAAKLMLKWPNLYYSTSAFAPRYYPADIINFANTRGAGKVMYAGYFPMGLSLDRIFAEMPNVPFKDEVWPKFLRENALRVFKLDG